MPGGDFSTKEFKKSYDLPKGALVDQMVSFVTSQGQMVIEMPLKETQTHPDSDLFPKIADDGKSMSLAFRVPASIDPSKCHVTIKDRDLIVKAEDKIERPDGSTKFYFYKRTTLPENTDFNNLHCNWSNHKLSVNAPLNLDYKPIRKVSGAFHWVIDL